MPFVQTADVSWLPEVIQSGLQIGYEPAAVVQPGRNDENSLELGRSTSDLFIFLDGVTVHEFGVEDDGKEWQRLTDELGIAPSRDTPAVPKRRYAASVLLVDALAAIARARPCWLNP